MVRLNLARRPPRVEFGASNAVRRMRWLTLVIKEQDPTPPALWARNIQSTRMVDHAKGHTLRPAKPPDVQRGFNGQHHSTGGGPAESVPAGFSFVDLPGE
jgi:hypothetical protein